MNIVFDACSIINLLKADVLQKTLTIPDDNFYIGELLLHQELLIEVQKIKVETFVVSNKIKILESTFSLSEFNRIKSLYNLGVGESECIALCKKLHYSIATDDQAAREAAKKELGRERVIGSIGILYRLISHGISTIEEAYQSYLLMLKGGAFLPRLEIASFSV